MASNPTWLLANFNLLEVKTVHNIMRRRPSSGSGLRSSASVYKFLVFKLQEQNTFWDFITDAPHFRYGGSFTFDKAMQEKALAVKVAIKEFREALEQRQEKKS